MPRIKTGYMPFIYNIDRGNRRKRRKASDAIQEALRGIDLPNTPEVHAAKAAFIEAIDAAAQGPGNRK